MTPHALIAPARLAGASLLRAQSDERLVDLVRAGNDAAFEAVVARYRKPLLRYCAGFLGEARAEDVVQQALVSAYGSLRSSEGEMSLRPWLYRIAHNTALNALRDRALSHEELSESLDGVPRPDQLLEGGERFRDVMGAVAALPEHQRDAIVLREMGGRSYDEIAVELGVTGGAVRQLLNRARTTLRTGMAAITPLGLLARVPLGAGSGSGSEVVAVRMAELAGAGAGATVLSKVAATALVTGAVMGGVAGSPGGGIEDGATRGERQQAVSAGAAGGEPDARLPPTPADERVDVHKEPVLRRGEGADEDRSGPGRNRGRGGSGGRDGREDNSGPGSAGDRDSDDSAPGRGRARSGGDERADESSGSGSGRSGSGGSGSSGSGSSGSGPSGSGSEPELDVPEPFEPDSLDSSGSGMSGSGSSGSE